MKHAPMSQPTHEVTQLLLDWRSGDKTALDKLTPLVYAELRRVAASYLREERAGGTPQPTALIQEAYVRLIDPSLPDFQNRSHFFGVAAQLMRQILVDHARQCATVKRDSQPVTVTETMAATNTRSEDVIALDSALQDLERIDPRKTRIVELRFFAGLTIEETAQVIETSVATIHRELKMAETWLYRRLNPLPA